MSLGHHGNISTAYGLEAVTPETERTTVGDEELQLPTVPFTLSWLKSMQFHLFILFHSHTASIYIAVLTKTCSQFM